MAELERRGVPCNELMDPMKFVALVSVFVAASALVACADAPPPTDPGAALAREISRDDAVTAARDDAALRYRMVNVSSVQVNRSGGFWVIDLRGQAGAGVRYAITAADGSIREARMIQ